MNSFLMNLLGLASAPMNVHSVGGAICVLALAYFPFVTLLTISGLKTLVSRCEEAALTQHGTLRTVARVTLPMVRPQIGAAAPIVFVFSIIDFGVPDVLRVQVYPVGIFIPFTKRALYSNLQQLTPRLIEAGTLARVSGFLVAWRILLPLLRNGLLPACRSRVFSNGTNASWKTERTYFSPRVPGTSRRRGGRYWDQCLR